MEAKENFCTELHRKTKEIHDQSDKLVNLKLAIAITDLKLYGYVLFDFYHVYVNIENALETNRDDPSIAPILLRDMFRAEQFEKDLNFYLGDDWKTSARLSSAAKEYCDRIVQVSTSNPELLIAYAHSMFMAIMAGGQMISRLLKKTLGLPDDQGLAIFQFEDCDQSKLKEQFKSNIDALELDRETKDRIIAEKIRVFQMNNKIVANVKPSLSSYKRIAAFCVIGILIFLFILFCFYMFLT